MRRVPVHGRQCRISIPGLGFLEFTGSLWGTAGTAILYVFPKDMAKTGHMSHPTGHNPGLTRADPVAMTQHLVRIPSVNPLLEDGGDGEGTVAALVAEWLGDWGYRPTVVEVAPGRHNVVARRGAGAGPSLLLNGHMDTVGVAGMAEPFSGAIREGRMYGRGSADMKSGVACALAVAAELAEAEIPGELIIALTADEEHASVGMAALVADGVGADAAVVCEPTSLTVMPAHKGFLWIDAHVKGRAAHGSRPELGVDAIAHMGRLLIAFEEEAHRLARETDHALLGAASLHAGTIKGGSAPSVYPDCCHLVVERRTLPGETADSVMAEVEEVLARAGERCPGLEGRVDRGLFRAATEVPASSPLVAGLREACMRSDLPGTLKGMSAWVDACFLNEHGTPAVCFGPGSIAQAHAAVEWVSVAEIETCARILTDFARWFLRAGES